MSLLYNIWGPYKKFGIYHLRWQMGLILTPVMILFIDYLHLQTWIALILFNIVGATIFFPIDKYIFKSKATATLVEAQSNKEIKITS